MSSLWFSTELPDQGHALSKQSLMDDDSLGLCRSDAMTLSLVASVLKLSGLKASSGTSLPFAPILFSEGALKDSFLLNAFYFILIFVFLWRRGLARLYPYWSQVQDDPLCLKLWNHGIPDDTPMSLP